MKAKTFNIGERAIGGRIRVQLNVDEQEVTVTPLDWFTKKPVRMSASTDDLGLLENVLWDLTDVFHTDQIIAWLGEKGFVEAKGRRA